MLIQSFNYHTHTSRCGHGYGNDEDYINSAIASGYKILGFSEHIQYRADNGKYNRIDYEDFDEYFSSIRDLKKKYKDIIDIYCGLEVSFIPEWMQDIYEIQKKCDYLILGQHQGGVNSLKYDELCTDRDVIHYARDIYYALRTGLISIIAHPDYFMLTRNTWNDACEKAGHMICYYAKKFNIPLEFNLKGFRSEKRKIDGQFVYPYPNNNFWKIADWYKSPVIFGIDAHRPSELCDNYIFEIAEKFISNLNLNILHEFYPNNNILN